MFDLLIIFLKKTGGIDEDNANKLKSKLSMKKLFTGIFIALTVVGFVMIIVSIFFYYQTKWSSNQNQKKSYLFKLN